MDHVRDLVTAYCKRAGRTPPPAREDGSYVLPLENAGNVELSPAAERDTVMLRVALPSLKQERDRQAALRWLMSANLILAGRKRATLTLDEATDTPFLYDLHKCDRKDVAANQRSLVAFANEAAAFRKLLERRH